MDAQTDVVHRTRLGKSTFCNSHWQYTPTAQAVTGHVPMSICDNDFLHEMQRQINPTASCSNRRNAAVNDLPHLYFLCQLAKAKEMIDEWPAAIMFDGCSRKNGIRFEAFFSFVFFRLSYLLLLQT
jgi:hypothetical protein